MSSRILVIRFSSLGDVVLCAPVFAALKRRLPDSTITFLTRSRYADLHRNNPFLDTVRGFDPETEPLRDLVRSIRSQQYTRVVDLHRSLRSRLVSVLAGPRVRTVAGKTLARTLQVLRRPFKVRLPVEAVVDRYLRAAGVTAPDPSERLPVVYLSPDQLAAGRERAAALRGERSGRLIALLPGAKHPPKMWPAERFGALAAALTAQGDLPVVIPPPDAPGLADAVVRAAAEQGGPGCLKSPVLEEPMALAGFLAAVSGSVANDSGPMHVSAAVGTPTVGLFGPTSPSLGFAPVGNRVAAEHLGLSCSPCSRHGQASCYRDRRYCLEDLKPSRVAGTLYALMS